MTLSGLTPLAVARLMPDFTLPDLDGRPVSLSDYRGRRLLVFIWAPW